jgi:hypothetical protein
VAPRVRRLLAGPPAIGEPHERSGRATLAVLASLAAATWAAPSVLPSVHRATEAAAHLLR